MLPEEAQIGLIRANIYKGEFWQQFPATFYRLKEDAFSFKGYSPNLLQTRQQSWLTENKAPSYKSPPLAHL